MMSLLLLNLAYGRSVETFVDQVFGGKLLSSVLCRGCRTVGGSDGPRDSAANQSFVLPYRSPVNMSISSTSHWLFHQQQR